MRKNAQVYTLDTRPPRWEHGVRMMVGSVLPWEVQTGWYAYGKWRAGKFYTTYADWIVEAARRC